jgi:hypothetical protein
MKIQKKSNHFVVLKFARRGRHDGRRRRGRRSSARRRRGGGRRTARARDGLGGRRRGSSRLRRSSVVLNVLRHEIVIRVDTHVGGNVHRLAGHGLRIHVWLIDQRARSGCEANI